MSIELFLGVNLAADLALLTAVSRALGCFDGRRVLLSGALCAAYAALAAVYPHPWAGLPVQLMMLAALSALLTGGLNARVCLKAAALLWGGALLSGGVWALTRLGRGGPAAAACALAGAALLALMLSARRPHAGDWQVRLAVTANGRTVRFPALIDTGNRLREPLSGQPVLIAEARLLRDALPSDGWRFLDYGSVGGGGRMRCFKPAGLWIERGRGKVRGPNVWIALSPGPLPGSARALAPSEFASYL